jgi:hypothetical protein
MQSQEIKYIIQTSKQVTTIQYITWFSPGSHVFSTNKTDRNEITYILLKVVFNTIKQTNK